MNKTTVIPQVEAEQVKKEAQQERYIAYAQCIHMLEAEAKEKADSAKAAEIGGRA